MGSIVGDKGYPQSNLELTVLASVYRRKSSARDAGFTVEDICMLSESWAPADFLYASFWVWTTEGLFVLESSVPGRMA